MKRKKILSILILIFTCLMNMTFFTACKEEHTHDWEYTHEALDDSLDEVICFAKYSPHPPFEVRYLCICKSCNQLRKHVWSDKTTQAPTCYAKGFDAIKCTLCNYTKKDNFTDQIPHTFENTYTISKDYHHLNCTTEGCDYKKLDIHTFSTDGVCTICQYALPITENVSYEVIENENYAKVVKAPEETRHILVSDTYNGVPVTVVDKFAFEDLWRLHTVILPDSITTIEQGAFTHSTNLSTLIIGSGLTHINGRPFSDCRALHTIHFMGTMEQWNAVVKDEYWKMGSYLKEIVCIDGTIPVEGTLYRE